MKHMLQRRHFEAIAETLRSVKPARDSEDNTVARVQWERTVRAFTGLGDRSNPGFQQDRFLAACGYGDTQRTPAEEGAIAARDLLGKGGKKRKVSPPRTCGDDGFNAGLGHDD